jgi:hypothetical protein
METELCKEYLGECLVFSANGGIKSLQKECPMKVNVTVDCTPEEARKFMGLPDVKQYQEEMMKILREKSIDNLKMMEPEAAMKAWMPMMNQGMAQGMDMFKAVMTGAATGSMTGSRKKK